MNGEPGEKEGRDRVADLAPEPGEPAGAERAEPEAGRSAGRAGRLRARASRLGARAGTAFAPRRVAAALGVVVLAAGAFLAGTCVAGTPGTGARTEVAGSAGDPEPEAEHEHGLWTCSMHPQIRSEEPGQCPICGMDLIPLEEGSGAAGEDGQPTDRVTLSDRARALARIRTSEVRRAETGSVELRLLGRVTYDERRVRTVTSWTEGRIDRLHVAVTGQRVRRGATIATLYSPEIYAAQQDLIQSARQVERLRGGTEAALRAALAAHEAVRQRLALLGVPEAEVERMQSAERPFREVSIRTPFAGTVIERLVDEGQYVSAGSGIYRVADLTELWVQLDAYERDLASVSVGDEVTLAVATYPGEVFRGRVAFVDPVLDPRTRTSRVRVEVANSDGRLSPGMFAEAVVEGEGGRGGARPPLVVPASAPLFTGRRSVVYVEVPDQDRPTYQAREVRLGPRAGEVYPVVAGLTEGERVVTEGAFALDADLQIRGGRSMMSRPDDSEPGELDRAVPGDQAFARGLEPVLGAYLATAERLAADDLEAARRAFEALGREVGRAGRPASEEGRRAWEPVSEALAALARGGAGAVDLAAARDAFHGASRHAIDLLERFGNPLPGPVRLAFCPMAFEDRGAEWVQRGEEIANPYFGASMLRCGEVRARVEPGRHLRRRLPAEERPAAPTPPAGEHRH